MADINNQLDKTEKELKEVEQQAIKTESAVKKVTEAEQEAMMRAALAAAQAQVKPAASKEQSTSLYETVKKLADMDKIKEHGTEKYFNNFLKSIKTNELAQNKLNSNPESFIESLSGWLNTESKNFTVPSLVKILNDSGLDTNIEKLNKINELQKEILERANKLGVTGNAFIGENAFNHTATDINILTKYIEALKMLEDEINKVKDVSLRNKIQLTYEDLAHMADGHSKVPFGKYSYNDINNYFNNNLYDALIQSGKSSEQADKIIEKFDSMSKEIQARLNNIGTDKITEKVPEQVKSISDKVVKAVETATNTIKENVNNTVQYVNNAVNGFTLVGGIAEQVKKQFALVPVGKPYVKGDNFNMYDPDAKQLPAVINDSTTALSTEFNNDVIERIKLFYEYLKRIAVLKQSLSGNFNIDSGIGAPEGAFSNSINNLADNAQRQQQEEIKNTEKAYEELRNKVSEVMSSIKHAISNVIGVIRTANNILHKVGSTIISVFNGAMHTVQRIIQLFGNLGDRVGLTNKNTNILKGSFTELKSAIDLLAGALNKLFNNQFIEQGRKLLSSIQSLKMIMGNDLTTATIEWANQMEDAFGLSANELITNLREVTAVMYGLGMSAKDVQVGARNLESVGMVLSSISGLGFDVVMSKIQSGMKGMTQAIDDLGLSVRESQMDAYLKKLKAQGGEFANISTSFSQLNEQQRVYVRYAAIMDQFMTKEAYTVENYAKALRTTTGSINVLTSQLNGLKSSIGTLALGLFSKVLQPLIYIVYYIRQLIIQLGTFLGIKMKLDANMNGGGGVDTTPIEEETDALDEMTDAANKAKGALDELDHISTMSSSSGSGKGAGSDFDYSSLLGGYDFADALAEYDANFIEECKQRLIDMVEHLLNRITEFIKEFTGRVISWKTIKENLDAVWTHIKSIFHNILSIAKTTFGIISGLIYNVFNDLGFTTLLKKLTGVLTTFTFGVDTMLKRIAPYITKFYDKYLAGYVRKFGELLSDKLDWLQEKANAFAEKWLNMDDATLEAKMDALGEKFKNLLKILKEIAILFKTIFGKDTEADNAFFNGNASENMKKLKETAEKLHSILDSIWDIIKQLFKDATNPENIGKAIDWINEKLERVREFVRDHKADIIKLVEKVAETLGKLAEAKFDLIMTVLEFITSHSNEVIDLLNIIQGFLKDLSEHPVRTLSVVVGLQLAGQAIKTAITAAIWKNILGIGSGGALTTALSGVGTTLGALLETAVSGVPGAVGVLAFAGAILFEGKKLADYIKEGVETANNNALDRSRTASGAFGSLDGNLISSDKIEYWTYDIIKSLRELYGNDFTKEQTEKALAGFRSMLQQQGQLTSDEIDLIMGNVTRDFEDIKKNTGIGIFGLDSVFESRLTENDKQIQEYLKGIVQGTNNASTSIQEDINNANNAVQSFENNLETASGSVVKSLDEITYQFDDIEQSTSTSLSSINGNVTTLDDIINGTANNVSSSIGLIEQAASRASSAVQSFSNAFKELFSSNIAEKLRELADIKINIGNFGAAANLINGTKTTNVKGFKGYANGGLPSTGSLFMANEDGNTELVGNFGGYTGVANQSMIISAMESAVYNAVTQALKANGGNGGQTTIEVCKGGVFVGDEAGLRKFVNQINNINATGRTNIANVGFSMT